MDEGIEVLFQGGHDAALVVDVASGVEHVLVHLLDVLQ